MYVYVTNLYSGETRPYQGDEDYLKLALLTSYPFLYRYTNQHMPLESILRELQNAQAYHIEVERMPEDDLHKTMGEIEKAIGHDLNARATDFYDHDAMMKLHPEVHQDKVNYFEANVNKTPEVIPPVAIHAPAKDRRAIGVEGKAFYNHGKNRYLIKGGAFHWDKIDAIGGFNEIASQAAYHAAGIGHLHQAVHATYHEGDRRLPAIAIHMEPEGYKLVEDVRKALQAQKENKPIDFSLQTQRSNHTDSYSKMAIMDHLLGNFDRHEGNFWVKPDGSPIAIDNGGSFTVTNALSRDATRMAYQFAAPGCLEFSPDVIKWWDDNKEKISNTLTSLTRLIKDPEYRTHATNLINNNFLTVGSMIKDRKRAFGFESTTTNDSTAEMPVSHVPSGQLPTGKVG